MAFAPIRAAFERFLGLPVYGRLRVRRSLFQHAKLLNRKGSFSLCWPPSSKFACAGAAVAAVSLGSCSCHLDCSEPDARSNRIVRAHYLRPNQDEIALLRSCASQDSRLHLSWGEQLPENAKDITILIARTPTGDELDKLAPSLVAVVTPFAGPIESTRALMKERPHLTLHNCHFNATSTAELAIALLMAAVKRVAELDARMRCEISEGIEWSAGWDNDSMICPTLHGRGALVLGGGAIGSKVARILDTLGMDVHVVRRFPRSVSMTGEGIQEHGVPELPSLLPKAFAMLVCLPGTPATAGMISEKELEALPRGAVLVNVGRGSIVDEHALFKALQDGHLSAAGLDVWYNYPMLSKAANLGPASVPFHELKNVIMSPHRGQASDTRGKDRVEELVQMLTTFADTGVLPNRFDLNAGY